MPRGPHVSPWGLTRMQAKILDCTCIFGRTKQIAAHLDLSEKTVLEHLYRIYEKMGFHDDTCEIKQRRGLAITMWLQYWATDEAKATLRNAKLTRRP